MSKPIEHYYAIRIGDPRRHSAYFKLRDNGLVQLFHSRYAAEQACKRPKQCTMRVVKVVVRQP